MSWLERVPSGRKSTFRGGPPAPAQPFFAIGDVHGRADLLVSLLAKLESQSDPIILVGDYIDRGEASAVVLHILQAATLHGQVICLRGNHEDMMLKFINEPKKHGRNWLRFGGLQTLASFGIGGLAETATADELENARDALVASLGEQLGWIRALPYIWQSGNMAVVHAGADPNVPLEKQSSPTFAWGHPDFDNVARPDGTWVIYGHTVVPKVQIKDGRVAIDTGAYATGQLSAVHVTSGSIDPV